MYKAKYNHYPRATQESSKGLVRYKGKPKYNITKKRLGPEVALYAIFALWAGAVAKEILK